MDYLFVFGAELWMTQSLYPEIFRGPSKCLDQTNEGSSFVHKINYPIRLREAQMILDEGGILSLGSAEICKDARATLHSEQSYCSTTQGARTQPQLGPRSVDNPTSRGSHLAHSLAIG